jgi:ABC-type sulfate/molybdate transport systems ATPase subunit
MGLANRVVADGEALAEAVALAQQLGRFPQNCLRSDRLSAYEQWGMPLAAALRNEYDRGVTVILTTHYIEEAEEMADRVGVIAKGELILVEKKETLMKKLGKKLLTFSLRDKLDTIPDALKEWDLSLKNDGHVLEYTFDTQADRTGVASLVRRMGEIGVSFNDLDTKTSSLEEIFVSLVHSPKTAEMQKSDPWPMHPPPFSPQRLKRQRGGAFPPSTAIASGRCIASRWCASSGPSGKVSQRP